MAGRRRRKRFTKKRLKRHRRNGSINEDKDNADSWIRGTHQWFLAQCRGTRPSLVGSPFLPFCGSSVTTSVAEVIRFDEKSEDAMVAAQF